MTRSRITLSLLVVAVVGCGEVKNGSGGNGGTGGTGGGPQCGQRGQPCCASSMCNPRASCDGTACIAADVWASEMDGTFNFNGGTWTQPLIFGTTQPLPSVNGL